MRLARALFFFGGGRLAIDGRAAEELAKCIAPAETVASSSLCELANLCRPPGTGGQEELAGTQSAATRPSGASSRATEAPLLAAGSAAVVPTMREGNRPAATPAFSRCVL